MKSSLTKMDETENLIKKWNYDSSTNILEIEAKQACIQSKIYTLSMLVLFKSYGTSFTYDKTLKESKSYLILNK
jgi:hypothetical protein